MNLLSLIYIQIYSSNRKDKKKSINLVKKKEITFYHKKRTKVFTHNLNFTYLMPSLNP